MNPNLNIPTASPFDSRPTSAQSMPAGSSGEELPDFPRSMRQLMAGLAAYLQENGAEISLSETGIEILIGYDNNPDRYIYFTTTPGVLLIFSPIGVTVPETDTEEDVEAYLDGLTQTIPMPKVFEAVAAYEKNDKTNELGILLRWPMPITFSAAAFHDSLWLIDWVWSNTASLR
jgi:hypothetical protein